MNFRNSLRVALVAVIAINLAATDLFFAQGGFGGGHGRFDYAIYLLGLPWARIMIAIPESRWLALFQYSDYLWLIAVPFMLNLSLVLALAAPWRKRSG